MASPERVKIFLASSSELEGDRRDFEIFINRKNKAWTIRGIFLELVIWEDFHDAVSETRKQDDYNRDLETCDLFVMLFHSKVGKYTREEFEVALARFRSGGKPSIYTYYKPAPESDTAETVEQMHSRLKEVDHFFTRYDTAVGLVNHFSNQLDKLVRDGTIVFPPESFAYLNGKVLLYANALDYGWTETYILPALKAAGIDCYFQRRVYDYNSIADFRNVFHESSLTLVVSSVNLTDVERQVYSILKLDQQSEILDRKLRVLCLAGATAPEGIAHVINCPNSSSPEGAIEQLIRSLQAELNKIANLPVYPLLPPECIDTSRLPFAIENHLFGRQKELDLLDHAWEEQDCHLIYFVAQGGMGKSALTGRWVENMGRDHFRGAQRVFAWSFYSQGTSERVTDADKFISEALRWFGESGFEQLSPWDKGKLLARCVQAQRTLLILDGLEPLQDTGIVERGKVKDPALYVLLRELAKQNPGLCLISTREPLGGLDRYETHVRVASLEALSDGAGIALLRAAGVRGTDAALGASVHNFGNHALAIQLLGRYLRHFSDHPIEEAMQIPDLPKVEAAAGKHPRRVIAAYERLLLEKGEDAAVELLRSFGLFDRPVEEVVLRQIVEETMLNEALKTLRRKGLLYPESEHAPDIVDCHPLIREHYAEILLTEQPNRWQQAHSSLYEYYQVLPKKMYPDTLEEMEPLFLAIAHGCRSGRYHEVLHKIYIRRIRRGDLDYCSKQLCAIGAELSAVAYFFERLWDQPIRNLNMQDRSLLFNFAGSKLVALGSNTEAVQSYALALGAAKHNPKESYIARHFLNHSELLLSIGEVQAAIFHAEEGCKNVEKYEKDYRLILAGKGYLADALLQGDNVDKAKKLFGEAEQLLATHKSRYTYLYGPLGYKYCDLLLEEGLAEEVLTRAFQTLAWTKEKRSRSEAAILSLALDQLSIGRAHVQLSIDQDEITSRQHLDQAQDFLNQSVSNFRRANTSSHLPKGLLARAAYYRRTGNLSTAHEDLSEVLEIAERGGMRLYLTDYHIEAARLELQVGDRAAARSHVEQAAALVAETGYHRRDGEVAELKHLLEG